jgi:hypothetical protein
MILDGSAVKEVTRDAQVVDHHVLSPSLDIAPENMYLSIKRCSLEHRCAVAGDRTHEACPRSEENDGQRRRRRLLAGRPRD